MYAGYTSVLRAAQGTFIHRANQCTVKGFDRSGSITSILDICIQTASLTVNNNMSLHYSQEYVNILARTSTHIIYYICSRYCIFLTLYL